MKKQLGEARKKNIFGTNMNQENTNKKKVHNDRKI